MCAKFAGRALNYALNSVVLEDDMSNSALNVTQELPTVTSFADAGPRRVVGNYDYNISLEGAGDFASGQSDATIFALVGSTGVASAWDPTGAAAGANDPNYDATSVVLESYSITAAVGEAVTYSATVQGNSALARTVA
jgi:hypothetical protein